MMGKKIRCVICAVLILFSGICGRLVHMRFDIIDIPPQEVPLASRPGALAQLMPEAPGKQVKKNEKAAIDYSNTSDGYVMIRYSQETEKPLRVIITAPGGVLYTYTIQSSMAFEAFPLSCGSGVYLINVYEGLSGGKYAAALSLEITVALANEFAPFLRPNKFVNYQPDNETIRRAEALTYGADGFLEKVTVIYNYVTESLRYDKELAASVQNGYVPDVDAVLKKGTGICFDYAAVTAAMLRSQLIPTKLVVGYTGDLCHAWISVYSQETGWVDGIIFFDGESWKLMNPTFASSAAAKNMKKYTGDGVNYVEKYLY